MGGSGAEHPSRPSTSQSSSRPFSRQAPPEPDVYRDTILAAYKGFCLRDVYQFHCDKIGVKSNSGVKNSLPTRVGDFSEVVEMDFSPFHLGEAGAYPVLEVARAAWKLEVLRLRGTGLSNDTAALICQVALDHPRLRTIDIADNPFISTPGIEAFIKLARRRALLCSAYFEGTHAPPELVRKLNKMLGDNRAEFTTPGMANTGGRETWFGREGQVVRHAISFDAAIDGLTKSERYLLCMPILTRRLHQELGEETRHFTSLQKHGFMLPELLRWEIIRADACFAKQDGNGSGLLSHKGCCDAMREMTGVPVTPQDADFEFLFNRVDQNDDGFVDRDEWYVLVRNVLGDLAAEQKATRQRQLERAYRTTADGDEAILFVSDLAAAAQHAAAITGAKDQPPSVEEKAREILLRLHSATSAVQEDTLPMPIEHFIEVMMTAECIINPSLRHAVINRKALVPKE